MPKETIRSYFTNLAYEKFKHVSTLVGSIKPNAPDESYQRELIRDALTTAMSYAFMAQKHGEYLMSEKDRETLANEAKHQENMIRESGIVSTLTQKMPLEDLTGLLAAPEESRPKGYVWEFNNRLDSYFLEIENLSELLRHKIKDGLDAIMPKSNAGNDLWDGFRARPWRGEKDVVLENIATASALLSVMNGLDNLPKDKQSTREVILEAGRRKEALVKSPEFAALRQYATPRDVILIVGSNYRDDQGNWHWATNFNDDFESNLEEVTNSCVKQQQKQQAELKAQKKAAQEKAEREVKEREAREKDAREAKAEQEARENAEAEAKQKAWEEEHKPPTEKEWLRDYLDNAIAHAAAEFASDANAEDWDGLNMDNDGAIQTIAEITAAYQMLQNAGDEIVTDRNAMHRRVNDRAWQINAQGEYRSLLGNTTPKDFTELLVANTENFEWRSAEDVMSRMGKLLAGKDLAPEQEPEQEAKPEQEQEPEKEPEPQPQPEQEAEPEKEPEPQAQQEAEQEEPYHELTDEEIDKLSPEETVRMLQSEMTKVARLMEKNGEAFLTDRAEYAAMRFERSLRRGEEGARFLDADRNADQVVDQLNKEPGLASLVEKNHLLGSNYQKLLWHRAEQVGAASFLKKIPPKKDEPQLTDEQIAACDRDTMRVKLGREFDNLARALKEQGFPEWETAVEMRRSIRRLNMTGEDFKDALDSANEDLSRPLGETGETIGDFAKKNGMMGAYYEKLMNRAGEIADVWAKEKVEEEEPPVFIDEDEPVNPEQKPEPEPEKEQQEPEPELQKPEQEQQPTLTDEEIAKLDLEKKKAQDEPKKEQDEPKKAPENATKWLEDLKTVTNTRDYVETLQREIKGLPTQNPKPGERMKLGLAVAAIFAARTAINAKAGSFRGSALDTPRKFDDEARFATEIGTSETFTNYINSTPYEKLRSLVLTGHGGEMEKSFRSFIAKGDKLPEKIPDRLMPTAKERCEELQKKLRSKPEDVNLYRELIATRQAVKAKTGGENLDKTPKAETVNQRIAESQKGTVLGNLLEKIAEDPKARSIALKGHGGKFTEIVLENTKLRNAPEQEKTAENSKQRSAAGPEKAKQ